MKKTLLLLAALAFTTAGTAFAQTAPAPTATHEASKPPSPRLKKQTATPAKWPRNWA